MSLCWCNCLLSTRCSGPPWQGFSWKVLPCAPPIKVLLASFSWANALLLAHGDWVKLVKDTWVETLVVSFEHTSFSRHSRYFHRGELLPWVAITFSTVHSLSCFFFLLLCSCFHIITLLLVYIHIHMHWVWSLHHGPSSHSRIYTCMCSSWGPAISWHAI